MFNQLFKSLAMTESFESFIPSLMNHLQDAEQMFKEYLQTTKAIDPSLADGLKNLSQEGFSRLLTSPYFHELLTLERAHREPSQKERRAQIEVQILRAIVAEIKIENSQFTHSLDPVWTINGDRVLKSEVASQFPPLQTECGIQLNYQAYQHNTDMEGIGGYSYEWALKHKERIETGKDIIRQVSPAALSLVDIFTTIIQFRQNSVKPNVINSSSERSLGVIYCNNFHKIHTDMSEVVDMLVHESIHQHLHLFEEQVTPFLRKSEMSQELLDSRSFPSPWSGKLLDISSYTHAILVWYGLAHFWSQYLESDYRHPEVSTQLAQDKLNEALYGFKTGKSVLNNLGEHQVYLNEEYRAWVQFIEKDLLEKRYA